MKRYHLNSVFIFLFITLLAVGLPQYAHANETESESGPSNLRMIRIEDRQKNREEIKDAFTKEQKERRAAFKDCLLYTSRCV